MKHYQVAVIGGGPGGYEAAIRLNQYGIDCVLIEKERIGGVCLNWGCIPTKALVKSSELWHEISVADSFGLSASQNILDYTKVFERKNEVVEKLVSGVEFLFEKRKIPVLKATVTSLTKTNGTYIVTTDAEDDISAEYVIVATGSVPKELPDIRINETNILSSTGILRLDKLPSSLAVIGGGIIGCEFASIYAAFGVEVYIIEFLPTLISTEDDEIAKRLAVFLKKSGIKVKTGVSVESFKEVNGNLSLQLSDGTNLEVEKVLLSVGRNPVFNINCKPDSPSFSKGALAIDNFMRTSLPNLYAIGDVTAKLPLAHTASKQGLLVAEHIRSQIQNTELNIHKLIYENIPRCIFTNPEVGSCGLTEKQASELLGEIKVGKFLFTANGKALAGGNTNGFVKIIAKADDLQIVGMHIIGPNAAELIAQGSILINLKAKAEDVEKVVFAHPTLSEAIMEAIEDLQGHSIHKM